MEFIDFRLPLDGFAQPLLLWGACHQRGQRVALLLQRLFAHLNQHGPSDATRVTAAEVRRYLGEAAPRHHADEDLDLFPRLRRQIDARGEHIPDAGRAVEALGVLERDHLQLEDQWGRMQAALAHAETAMPTAEHCAVADDFVDRFITHHEIEDQIVAPVAQRALTADDLAAIGASMAARRGTTWAALSTPMGRH
ncbi:MAG: hemerythrin domain-containing protein [Burkholderiaceae bacterium]|nr:hemerythrin domain-containing protein [Burkholderiaceae bacterium]